jgi:hypothetical protein
LCPEGNFFFGSRVHQFYYIKSGTTTARRNNTQTESLHLRKYRFFFVAAKKSSGSVFIKTLPPLILAEIGYPSAAPVLSFLLPKKGQKV